MLAALEDEAWAEAEITLRMLASFGVQLRFHPERFTMLWKPKFSDMPIDWQESIRDHGIALVRCLVPRDGVAGSNHRRPGWKNGPVGACVGCGGGVSLRDPLGQPRHDWCGWLGQPPQLLAAAPSGAARKLRRQGRQ